MKINELLQKVVSQCIKAGVRWLLKMPLCRRSSLLWSVDAGMLWRWKSLAAGRRLSRGAFLPRSVLLVVVRVAWQLLR